LADIAEELTPFHSAFAYNLSSIVSQEELIEAEMLDLIDPNSRTLYERYKSK
jgi:hypothetical protein